MNKCPLLFLIGLALPMAARAAAPALVIDQAESSIRIDVRSTLDSFVAQLQDFEAVVSLDPGKDTVRAARFHFLFSHLKTGDAERDTAMYGWEDVAAHPEGSFVLSAVTPGQGRRFVARGRLRLHGVEREVAFPFTVAVEGRTLAIDGDTALDVRDYGLPIFRKFIFLRVDPVVRVRFHLLGRLAGS